MSASSRRTRTRAGARVTVVAIMAALALAGCGGGDDDTASLSDDEIADVIDENTPTSLAVETPDTSVPQDAFDALNDLEPRGGAAPKGFQTLISGDLAVEVPGEWQDVDLEKGHDGEDAIRAAPALSEFGNGGVGLGVSAYEEAYPTATILDTLESGLSTEDWGVPVSSCADQEEVDFPGNPEMTATVRIYGDCTGADPNAVWLLGAFAPTANDDVTVGVYAFATDGEEVDDLIYSLYSLSVEGYQP